MTTRYHLVRRARDLKDGARVRYFTDKGPSSVCYTLRRSDDQFMGERLMCKDTVILKSVNFGTSIALPDRAQLIWDCSYEELKAHLDEAATKHPLTSPPQTPIKMLGFDYGEGMQKSCFYVPETLFKEAGWVKKLYEALLGAGLLVEKGFTFYSKSDNYTKLSYTDVEPTRAVQDVRSVYCLALPDDISLLSLDSALCCERYFRYTEDVSKAHVRGAYMARLAKPAESVGAPISDVIIFPRGD